MEPEEIKEAVISLLYDLHLSGKLDLYVINSISNSFSINAEELCEDNGITYNIQ